MRMKNLNIISAVVILLHLSSCTHNENKRNSRYNQNKTKLKGDFIFEDKTNYNESLTFDKINDKKVKKEKQKVDSNLKKKPHLLKKIDSSMNKEIVQKQDPAQIPEKWSNTYSNDPKWFALYEETSNAFLNGWRNEFIKNPDTKISKEELIYAYRRRMEKIFYETPSFIEFCVNELNKSNEFETLVSSYKSNVN